MNSPHLSCRHRTGRGYQQSQLCVNLSRICSAVLLSMRISSTRFEAISMQVNALNSTQLLPMLQSALLVRVGDHNHGLLINIFGILCTSICLCDSATRGDNNVGSTSHVISFHQDFPLLGGTI
jgi:hypothetical protein